MSAGPPKAQVSLTGSFLPDVKADFLLINFGKSGQQLGDTAWACPQPISPSFVRSFQKPVWPHPPQNPVLLEINIWK